MHWLLKKSIKYTLTFLVVYTIIIGILSAYFLLSDDIIVDLNHEDLSFNLNFGDSIKVNYSAFTNNNYFCNAICEYEFVDLSKNQIVKNGKFVLGPKEQFNDAVNFSINDLGEGQQIFNYNVKCENIRTKVCRTVGGTYSANSFITVNFNLNESTEILKLELKDKLNTYLINMIKLDQEVQLIENRIYSVDEVVVFDEIKQEFILLTTDFEGEIINAENYKNEWAGKDYISLAKLFSDDLREIVISIDNLDKSSKEIIKKHNNLVIELNETIKKQNLLKAYYRTGIFFNNNELIQNSLRLKGEFENKANKLRTKNLTSYDEFNFEEINYLFDYNKILKNSLEKSRKEKINNLNFEQSIRYCDLLDDCNRTFDMCNYNNSLDNLSLENVSLTFNNKLIDIENAIINEINNLTQNLSIFANRQCLNLVTSLNTTQDIYYKTDLLRVINEKCNGTNLSINLDNITLINNSLINITKVNSSFFLEKVNCDYPESNISFEINYTFDVVKEDKFNYTPKLDKDLSKNLPVCCVLGECEVCCSNCSDENYPILFIHGHAFSEVNSPEYSIGAFNKIQNSLQNEGYLNAGILTPISTMDDVNKGEWGMNGHPITIRVTYYQDTIQIGEEIVIIPKKDESIEIYSDRLKDFVDMMKYRTGKNKVILVTHSMGGLVSRRYMQKYGEESVDKLIMIGTPNKGIDPDIERYCNYLGNEKECTDMAEDGRFIFNLNKELPSVDHYVIYGTGCSMDFGDGDGVVLSKNAILESSKNYLIEGICPKGYELHTDMLNVDKYPEVKEKIKEIISIS